MLYGNYELKFVGENGICLDSTIGSINVNQGDVNVSVSKRVCNDTIIINITNDENDLWLVKSNNTLSVERSTDKVLLVSLDFVNSDVTYVNVEGYRCSNILNYYL